MVKYQVRARLKMFTDISKYGIRKYSAETV